MGIKNILYIFKCIIIQLKNTNIVDIDVNNVEEVIEEDRGEEELAEDPRLRPHGQFYEDLGERVCLFRNFFSSFLLKKSQKRHYPSLNYFDKNNENETMNFSKIF